MLILLILRKICYTDMTARIFGFVASLAQSVRLKKPHIRRITTGDRVLPMPSESILYDFLGTAGSETRGIR